MTLRCLALVLAGAVGHAGDAVVFVAVEPGLDGAPGELAWVALLVEEGHGGDVVDALVAGASRGGVDGAQDAHLQIDRRLLHEGFSCCVDLGGRRSIEAKAWGAHDDSLRCWRMAAIGSGGRQRSALAIRSRCGGRRSVASAGQPGRGPCQECVRAAQAWTRSWACGWAGDDGRA